MPPKKGTTKKKSSGPKYADMIYAAIAELKVRGGASRQAIKQYVLDNYSKTINFTVFDAQFRMALKRGVENGALVQNKQSFRLSESAKRRGSIKAGTRGKKGSKKAGSKKAGSKKATKKGSKKTTKKKTTKKKGSKKATVAKKKASKPKKKAAAKKKTTTKKKAGTKKKSTTKKSTKKKTTKKAGGKKKSTKKSTKKD